MKEQIAFYGNKLQFEMDSADLAEAINNSENIVVIDTRSKEAFDIEHIPSAKSFPHRTMNENSTGNLDKNTLYVTYCDGIGCNGSTKGALNMAKLGFRVKELIGGLDWWKRDGHQTEGTMAQEGKLISCDC